MFVTSKTNGRKNCVRCQHQKTGAHALPPAAERSSGATTMTTYDWRAGTSIWLMQKRATSTAGRARVNAEHRRNIRLNCRPRSSYARAREQRNALAAAELAVGIRVRREAARLTVNV